MELFLVVGARSFGGLQKQLCCVAVNGFDWDFPQTVLSRASLNRCEIA